MIWSRPELSLDLRLLLDRERQIAVLPAAARARALSRARSALAAGVATRQSPSRAPSAFRWAAAAGLACVATVAAGAVAYSVGLRARPDRAAPSPHRRRRNPGSRHWSAGDEPFRDLLATPVLTGRRRREPGARVELRLLERARAAVAREDFVLAMQLLGRARASLQERAAGGRKGSAARQGAGEARSPQRGASRRGPVRSEVSPQPAPAGRHRDA